MVSDPRPAGSWASRPKGHKHVMRLVSWTLEGPLTVLTSCAYCDKVESIRPTRRMTKVRDGFTPETWAKLLDKAEERAKAMKEAA